MTAFLTAWGQREGSRRFVCAVAPLLAVAGIVASGDAAGRTAHADDVGVAAGATNYNSQRKVAVAPDGTVAVVYVVGGPEGEAVHAKISSDGGATWTYPPPLSRAPAFRPATAYDGSGVLHVAWTELSGESRQVFYARWDGGPVWEDRLQLSDSPGYAGYPSLAADAGDTIHLVWYGFDGSQYQIYYRARDPAGVWSRGVQASRIVRDANSPAIAIGPDGVVHVAYYAFVAGALDVQYMSGGQAGWTTPLRVNPKGVASSQPSLVVHGDGTAAIAFTAGTGDATWVAYCERHGRSWTQPIRLSGLGPGASAPSLSAVGSHAALAAFETSDGRVQLARLAGGGSWSRPEELADGGAQWPSLSWAAFPAPGGGPQEGAARIYAAWTATARGGNELRFARLEPKGPGPSVDAGSAESSHRPWVVSGSVLGALVLVLMLRRVVRPRTVR